MYDFYAKPPTTKDEIREYITTWLEPSKEETFIRNGDEQFSHISGFRRAFNIHAIYRSVSTNEYIWWVSEDGDLKTFPTKRYDSKDALIDDVVDQYFIQWNPFTN